MHQKVSNFVTKVDDYNLIFLYALIALTANVCIFHGETFTERLRECF